MVVRDLGTVPYADALALQQRLVDERIADLIPDTLLLLEHPPVITLGRRRGAAGNVVAAGDTPVVEVERGGDATWHGPGQLVGYPIFKLAERERDLHRVLRRLEDAAIEVLAALGLPGERKAGHTGVFVRDRKLVSFGVAVRGWVTYHGFAINVEPDLSQFTRINPCGLEARVMGSVASLGGRVPPRDELLAIASRAVARAFERDA